MTHDALFCCTKIPAWLKNSSGMFWQVMASLLLKVRGGSPISITRHRSVLGTREEHNDHVQKLLSKINYATVSRNLWKGELFTTFIEYVAHVVRFGASRSLQAPFTPHASLKTQQRDEFPIFFRWWSLILSFSPNVAPVAALLWKIFRRVIWRPLMDEAMTKTHYGAGESGARGAP